MGSLSTRFTLSGQVDADTLKRVREELSSAGVSSLTEDFGMVFVTYDPAKISNHTLAARLRSMGIPVS